MGRVKAQFMEYLDREFSEVPEKTVCKNCFKDEGLRQYIMRHGSKGRCSYCTAGTNCKITVSLEAIIGHIQSSLRQEYPEPVNSGTPYVTREGGWLVKPSDITEILREEPLEEEHTELFEDITRALNSVVKLKRMC